MIHIIEIRGGMCRIYEKDTIESAYYELQPNERVILEDIEYTFVDRDNYFRVDLKRVKTA